jgi:hypothetical protein
LRVLLLQLDGKLPNIALMRIAAHCRPYADDIAFRHCPRVKAVESSDWRGFDRIYASLIFERTRPVAEALLQRYRFAEVGGTGWDVAKRLEDVGIKTKKQDYGMYPHYDKRFTWDHWQAAGYRPEKLHLVGQVDQDSGDTSSLVMSPSA